MVAGGTWIRRGPFFDERGDVCEAGIARLVEIFDQAGGREIGGSQRVGTGRPDGRNPGQAGPQPPLVRDVDPEARADLGFDRRAGFEREQRGVADQQGSIGVRSMATGIGRGGHELRAGREKSAEQHVGVGERGAGGGIGGYGADGAQEPVYGGLVVSSSRSSGRVGSRLRLTISWMERTRSSEAMVHPGTMASSGVSAAMGMSPSPARPSCNSTAHCEGWV